MKHNEITDIDIKVITESKQCERHAYRGEQLYIRTEQCKHTAKYFQFGLFVCGKHLSKKHIYKKLVLVGLLVVSFKYVQKPVFIVRYSSVSQVID